MSSCVKRRFSITRLLRILLLAAGGTAGGGLVTGCAQQRPAAYTPPPLIIDEAMQLRDWERSVAYYPNGDTVSGVNRFPIRTDAEHPDPISATVDGLASLAQTVALPFTYLFVPPGTRHVYTGEEIGPTYTAMPPMEPADGAVWVDGTEINRRTLEVLPSPAQPGPSPHGPLGPADAEYLSSPPIPARQR